MSGLLVLALSLTTVLADDAHSADSRVDYRGAQLLRLSAPSHELKEKIAQLEDNDCELSILLLVSKFLLHVQLV